MATVPEVIATISANEQLLHEAAEILALCVPGLAVESCRVTVRSIVQESPLREYFAFAIVATYQKELEKAVPAVIHDLFDVQVPDDYRSIITVFVMLTAIYGISKAIERLFPGKKRENLDNAYAGMTHVAGDLIQVSPERIDEAMQRRFEKKGAKRIGAAARRFFAPVAGTGGSVRGLGGVEIPAEAVAEIPPEATPPLAEPDDNPETEFLNKVKIEVHAMDRDRGKQGWAGHIPDHFPERVRMIVDKTINLEALFGKREVRGDVFVVYDLDEDGRRCPREFHLLRVYGRL